MVSRLGGAVAAALAVALVPAVPPVSAGCSEAPEQAASKPMAAAETSSQVTRAGGLILRWRTPVGYPGSGKSCRETIKIASRAELDVLHPAHRTR